MKNTLCILSLLALLAWPGVLVLAEPGKAKEADKGGEPTRGAERGAASGKPQDRRAGHISGPPDTPLISVDIDSAIARQLALEHGLTGYKPLPPGIRKNLARGKPLPPGIAKTRLPSSMTSALPRYDGYEWRSAGTSLVLVGIASELVAAVLVDVFE